MFVHPWKNTYMYTQSAEKDKYNSTYSAGNNLTNVNADNTTKDS